MFGLILRLLWLVAWLVALPLRLARRVAARTRRGTWLLVQIDGPIVEGPVARRWWPPQRKPATSLHTLRRFADAAVRDPRVTGLVLILAPLHGGFAMATSLRELIARVRAAGKQVVVHLPMGGGTREAYVAVAADRVFLGPRAVWQAVGLLSSARYVRGALDRAGVVPEVHARGRYKTAAERIERTSMSEPQREQVETVLDGIHRELVRAVAAGRHVDVLRARALIDDAPYTGDEAFVAGLCDGVAYEDELATRLGEGGARARLRPAAPWWNARRALSPRALRSPSVIGVIRVHGAIASEGGMPLRGVAVDERVIAAIRLARANPVVRGVVLHVNSPGGGALASDRIYHELVQLAADKPLVACMGDVAASGGYYVAVAAPTIVAQPTTITGSIGVVGARVLIDPLLARIGVATEVLQRGAHARLLDPLLPLGDEEKAAVDRQIDRLYRAFVDIVAEGRKKPTNEIEALAQGRVWTGADAHARGLVDQLGGFEDAVDLVRARIGRGATRLRVVEIRHPRKPMPILPPPERKAARAAAAALESLAPLLGLDPALLVLGREPVLAWCDVTVRS
ncbi:MAG TPA: signal peptide peptidase SppA [Polyangiaceae bacterium]|nr:signal peptide peptidase SppA [Polyangiaceae bacterium]